MLRLKLEGFGGELSSVGVTGVGLAGLLGLGVLWGREGKLGILGTEGIAVVLTEVVEGGV